MDELVNYCDKKAVVFAAVQRSGYVYIHIGKAATGWWGDVYQKDYVMSLDFTACSSLTFSGPLTYVSLHPMPHKTVANEVDTSVGAGV